MRWIGLGWSAFVFENLVLSHNRTFIIENYTEKYYHLTYNILSSTACLSIGYGYMFHGRKKGPVLQNKPG